MRTRALKLAYLVVWLLMPGAAHAQAPSPEALAAARELVVVMRAADQVKAVLPAVMQSLKPAIVQGRPQIERDYDAVMPMLLESMNARFGELAELLARVYAQNFTVAEMKDLIAFYRSPTGQKLLARTPAITQQSMAAGQQFAVKLFDDLKGRVIEELRNKGHNI
jgi:uncharacterized protein